MSNNEELKTPVSIERDDWLYKPSPTHIIYRKTYIDGKVFKAPYETNIRLKYELKKGDVIVRRLYWETEEVDAIYKVMRINQKTITLEVCDQYGGYIPTRPREKELYKCSDSSSFKVIKRLLYDDYKI